MALTVIQQPPTRCYLGSETTKGNVAPFDFTSDLWPLNTTATPRTILDKGLTSSGFFYIEVGASFAAQFPTGGYLQGVQVGLQQVAYILDTELDTNWRIVLNISDPGYIVSSTTVVPAVNNYGVEIRVQASGYDRTHRLTSDKNDISGYLKLLLEETLGEVESIAFSLEAREVFTGSATSFSAVGSTRYATYGRLDVDQTDAIFNVVGGSQFMTDRPAISRVYEGQRVPLSFISTGGSLAVQDYGDFTLETPIIGSPGIQQITQDVFGDDTNSVTIGALSIDFQIIRPFLPFVELLFRNRYGKWDSQFFYFSAQRSVTEKDQIYIASYREAAIALGDAITNKGRQFFVNNTSRVWTMTTGKIGEEEAKWLSDLLASDSVWYRNGNNYYPVRILPSQVQFFDLTRDYPEVTFEMVSAFGLTLQAPQVVTPTDPLRVLWDEWNLLATTDGALPIESDACLFNAFRNIYTT